MKDLYEKVSESVAYLKNDCQDIDLAIVLGSGLGSIIDTMEDKVVIPYSEIPNFPTVTVAGHGGQLVIGTINDKKVLAMQGRFHFYEGYSMKEVTYPIFVMKQLNIKKLIVTNACGGINGDFQPGDLMIINDFINLMGTNPLIGVNDERFGPRFPDMSEPFKKSFVAHAKTCAKKLEIAYQEGVYGGFTGPYYETAAEIQAFKTMGVDAIGMSTVPETIVANYLQMEVLGISCITNMATGIQKVKHSHERVVQVANEASKKFAVWLIEIIKTI